MEDLPDGTGKAVPDSSGSVVLVRSGGMIRAWVNRCPHAQQCLTLRDGRVLVHASQAIVCPAHGASFDAIGGACVGGPAEGMSLEPVDIIVEDGLVKLVGA
ncbi:Rieske (2Fe-2S) protein [Maricaulis sp. CAU 1757]